MGLTKGNYPGGQMPQGLTDEQNREMQRGLILLQMRRYLRFFWIGMTILTMVWSLIGGHDSLGMTIIGGIFLGALGYGVTVWLFVYVLANWAIKIFLYLKSLFGGEARL
jgi:hypothetical protein